MRYVHVFGELDLSCVRDLETNLELAASSPPPVALDLSACRYIDSTIIGALLRCFKRWDHRFTIVLPRSHPLRRTFAVAGVDGVLPIVGEPGEI